MKNLSHLKYPISRFILVLLALCFASKGFGQQLDFIRQGPVASSSQLSMVKGVATDDEGNIYIAGSFRGNITFGSFTLSSYNLSYYDIFIVKYNSSGTVLWAKRAGGTANDSAEGIAVKDGYVYICGSFYDTANFNTPYSTASNTITSAYAGDMLLAKFDDDGNFIWARRAGGGDPSEEFTSIAVTDSKIYVTGEYWGDHNVDFNNPSATGSNEVIGNGNNRSIVLAQYDLDGNLQWFRGAGGSTGTTRASGMVATSDAVYVFGKYQGTITFGSGGQNQLASGNNANTAYLVKYGQDGDVVWAKRVFAPSATLDAHALAIYGSNLYLTGYYTKTITFGSLNLYTATTNMDVTATRDIYLACYNTNGDAVWAKRAGPNIESSKTNEGLSLAANERGIFLGAHFGETINFNTPSFAGVNEVANTNNIFQTGLLAKFDHVGNFQWVRRAGGETSNARVSYYSTHVSGTNIYAGGIYRGTVNFNTPSSPGTNEITSVSSSLDGSEAFLVRYIDGDAPKISVKGNSNWVINGNTTPTTDNNTDFGTQFLATNTVKTFNITNTGTIPLNLSGSPKVAISGANAADFTVTTQPTSPLVATTGATTFQITFTPASIGLKTATVSIANDDTDENPYTFTIQGTGQSHPIISAFAQDFAPKLVTSNLITIADNVRPALALADIDGDGLTDLLVGNSNGQLSHYEQTAVNSTTFSLQTSSFNSVDVGDNSVPAFADLDGDGLLDLLIGAETGRLFHYEQNAANSTTFTQVSNFFNSIDVGTTASPVFTDLDGDGLLDLIIGKSGGQLAHYEQESANSLTFTLVTLTFNSIDVGTDAAPTITDVDGDGLLDLIVGSDVGKFFHYEQASANSTTFTLVTNTYASIQQVSSTDVFAVFSDFDNDGLLDMLWSNSAGSIKHSEQGQGSFSCFSTPVNTPSATQALQVFGKDLQGNISVSAPANYEVSLSESSGFGSSVSIPASSGKILNTTVYVRFSPSSAGIFTGSLTVSSTNANSYTFELTNIALPTNASISSTNVCSETPITLTATCSTGTVQWYNQQTGGTAIGTGASFIHTPTTATSYYVSCKDGSCESSRSLAGSVTVMTKPAAPTGVADKSICAGNTASLTATCATGTVAWYNSGSTTLLFTGSTFVTPALTANATYNVRCEGATCNSNFVAANVTLSSAAATATETMTWTGTANNNWANGCNWTPNGIPTLTNQVVIPNTTNDPVVYSGTNAVAQRVVLRSDALLTTNTGASISVSDTVNSFNIETRATFTNNGTTTATNTGSLVLSKTTLAIADRGVVNNYGTMTINGNLNNGLYFTGTFNNKTGALLTCNGSNAINMALLGKLTNETGATINANGTTNGVVFGGVSVSSTNSGILNASKIEIVDGTTLSNQACGVIKITGNLDMSGSSIFQNAGYTYIGAQLGLYGGTVTNSGVLKFTTLIGDIANITNSYLIVNNAVPIFSYGNSFNGTVNGIFTDANATASAGTFTAPNTFTPSGLPQTSQTLYAKITPSGGACSYIVPFTYDNSPVPAINVAAEFSTFTSCSGTASTAQSFTISATSLSQNLVITAPTGFEIATSSGGTYSASLTLTPSDGSVAITTIYVRLKSTATGSLSGIITCESGSTFQDIAVSGNVTTLPTASINYAGGPFCKTGSAINVTRTGTAGGAFTSSPTGLSINGSSGQITPASSTAGTYTVTYTIAASGGCPAVTATASVTINEVSAPTINAPNPKVVCAPSTLTLTASGCAGTVTWSNSSTGTSLTLSSVGTYSITATCTVGSCTSPASTAVTGLEIVTQPTAPTINAPNPKVVCSPSTLTLTASGCAGTVTWSNSSTGTSLTLSNVGTYSITATCTVGSCTSPASTAVTGLEIVTQPTAPTINAPNPKMVCSPSTLTLTASGCAGTVTWSNSSTGTSLTLSSVGTYSITATCTVGSCTSPASTAVTGLEIVTQPTAPTINAPNPKVVC
uniref:FG-GAP-like repeat-containing protein n=1 Tax=Emticicia sp. 17c TaxID=3127704 RepID=UPI00301D0410